MTRNDIQDRAGQRTRRLIKVCGDGQLTLPGDIRRALQVEEGDYLEAEIVEGGVLLHLVTVVDKVQAWNRLERILGQYAGPGEEGSEQDAMTLAVQAIKAVRRGTKWLSVAGR